jgi:hypothetical protein
MTGEVPRSDGSIPSKLGVEQGGSTAGHLKEVVERLTGESFELADPEIPCIVQGVRVQRYVLEVEVNGVRAMGHFVEVVLEHQLTSLDLVSGAPGKLYLGLSVSLTFAGGCF